MPVRGDTQGVRENLEGLRGRLLGLEQGRLAYLKTTVRGPVDGFARDVSEKISDAGKILDGYQERIETAGGYLIEADEAIRSGNMQNARQFLDSAGAYIDWAEVEWRLYKDRMSGGALSGLFISSAAIAFTAGIAVFGAGLLAGMGIETAAGIGGGASVPAFFIPAIFSRDTLNAAGKSISVEIPPRPEWKQPAEENPRIDRPSWLKKPARPPDAHPGGRLLAQCHQADMERSVSADVENSPCGNSGSIAGDGLNFMAIDGPQKAGPPRSPDMRRILTHARDALSEWKRNPGKRHDYARFLIDAEVAGTGAQFGRIRYGALLKRWKTMADGHRDIAKSRDWQEATAEIASIIRHEANTGKEAADRGLVDIIEGRGGGKDAETKALLAAAHVVKAPKDFTPAIRVDADGARHAVYVRVANAADGYPSNEIWDPFQAEGRMAEGGMTLYDPHIFYLEFIEKYGGKYGIASPVERDGLAIGPPSERPVHVAEAGKPAAGQLPDGLAPLARAENDEKGGGTPIINLTFGDSGKLEGARPLNELAPRQRAKLQELLAYARRALTDPTFKPDYGRFFVDLHSTVSETPLATADYERYLAKWRGIEDRIRSRSGARQEMTWDEAAIDVIQTLGGNSQLGQYVLSKTRLIDLLEEDIRDSKGNLNGGRCTARGEAITSALSVADIEHGPGWQRAVQKFTNHIQTVYYSEATHEVWEPLANKTEKEVYARLFDPRAYFFWVLESYGEKPPVELASLSIVAPTAARPGFDGQVMPGKENYRTHGIAGDPPSYYSSGPSPEYAIDEMPKGGRHKAVVRYGHAEQAGIGGDGWLEGSVAETFGRKDKQTGGGGPPMEYFKVSSLDSLPHKKALSIARKMGDNAFYLDVGYKRVGGELSEARYENLIFRTFAQKEKFEELDDPGDRGEFLEGIASQAFAVSSDPTALENAAVLLGRPSLAMRFTPEDMIGILGETQRVSAIVRSPARLQKGLSSTEEKRRAFAKLAHRQPLVGDLVRNADALLSRLAQNPLEFVKFFDRLSHEKRQAFWDVIVNSYLLVVGDIVEKGLPEYPNVSLLRVLEDRRLVGVRRGRGISPRPGGDERLKIRHEAELAVDSENTTPHFITVRLDMTGKSGQNGAKTGEVESPAKTPEGVQISAETMIDLYFAAGYELFHKRPMTPAMIRRLRALNTDGRYDSKIMQYFDIFDHGSPQRQTEPIPQEFLELQKAEYYMAKYDHSEKLAAQAMIFACFASDNEFIQITDEQIAELLKKNPVCSLKVSKETLLLFEDIIRRRRQGKQLAAVGR